MDNLKCALMSFYAVSGLEVNARKSELKLVGNVRNINRLANILGSKVGHKAFTDQLPWTPSRSPFKK